MCHRKDYYAEKMSLAPLSEEGGYFKETFRSPQTLSTPDREGGERNLFTTIYYMISPELGGKNYLPYSPLFSRDLNFAKIISAHFAHL